MITTTIIVFLIVSPNLSFGFEKACSPYHYEEQTLEKMIRQEVAVEKMKSDMEDTKRKVEETLNDLNIEKNKLAVDLEEKTRAFEEMKTDMENAVADIKTRTEEMERMKSTVVTPFVAFKAQKATDKVSNNMVIVFTENLLNMGDAYNNKTGIFVAPVGGVYLFTAQICVSLQDSISSAIFIGERQVSRQLVGDHD